ncbi:uncharacterized protein TRAVEDRAFT_48088 [Trametes versicolor FP-101664 SS1]|uniref:uncharacterized protein n=1 Tax=Trametes versicolor (strain FP-101664) TaxID=717944 RepID=UPI0004623597|nr:uncharacterized protein TRAVEDRAFT_48088 [Trametes versicolor FP-101664 SS1]EIW58954.1 hypothetical protein TRAVEDRAFT_48088 [Trametes versicolor FP-101664 SS1]
MQAWPRERHTRVWAMGISVDELEVVPAAPVTPKMSKAEPKQTVDQLSPLTPVNSSDEGEGSLFEGSSSPFPAMVELPSTTEGLFPALSSSTSAQEGQVKDVIEIGYSDTDSQRSMPAVAHPPPEAIVPYIAVPPLPPYVVTGLKRVSSPSRSDFATQPRKKPKPAGRSDPGSSALTPHTRGPGDRAEHPSRHRSHRSGDNSTSRSSMPRVADNSASQGMVDALTRAAQMNSKPPTYSPPPQTKRNYYPPPRTIKKPHVRRRAVAAVILSDSEQTSTLPRGPSSAVLTSDMELDYPDLEEVPSLSGFVAPPSMQERAPPSVSGTPQIPRRSMLKRTFTDAALESDKPPGRTSSSASSSASSLASLGRNFKKRKGPPAISKEDVAKRQSEERSDDAPKTKGKLKASANSVAPGMSRRSSRASESRAMVSSTSGLQRALSAPTTGAHRTRGESSLNGSYLLPDGPPVAAVSVCAAIVESASRAEEARVEPSSMAKVNSPAPPPSLPPRNALVSDAPSASAFPSTSFAPVLPALRQPILDAYSCVDDHSARFKRSIQAFATLLPDLINSGLALASASRSDPHLEEEVNTLRHTIHQQDQKIERIESENVELRRQVRRQDEKIADVTQDLEAMQRRLQPLQDSEKKEREERNLMAQEVRNLTSKIERLEAGAGSSGVGMARLGEMI